MRSWARLIVAAATVVHAAMGAAAPPPDSESDKPPSAVTVGIFPFLPPARLEAFAGGITRQLSEQLKQPVEFRTRKDYFAYHEAVLNGQFDLAMVQPLNVPAAMAAGLKPMARHAQDISAVFLVRDDRDLNSLGELAGGIVALPAQGSMVEAMARQYLTARGLTGDFTLRHTATHTACIHAMLSRRVDSCATSDLPLAIARQRGALPIRILERTPGLPSPAYLARASLSGEDFARLQAAVISWKPPPENRAALKAAGMTEGWVASDGSEYLNLNARMGATR